MSLNRNQYPAIESDAMRIFAHAMYALVYEVCAQIQPHRNSMLTNIVCNKYWTDWMAVYFKKECEKRYMLKWNAELLYVTTSYPR